VGSTCDESYLCVNWVLEGKVISVTLLEVLDLSVVKIVREASRIAESRETCVMFL
jgi:hypothetical protein